MNYNIHHSGVIISVSLHKNGIPFHVSRVGALNPFSKLFTWVTPSNTSMNQALGASVRDIFKSSIKILK